MTTAMLWMAWVFGILIALCILYIFIVSCVASEAHTNIRKLNLALIEEISRRNEHLYHDISNQADEIREINKAVNKLECKLQTIKDLL